MRVKFNYVKAGKFKRPIIPITLKNGKKIINYLALVDSGADFNVFHKEIAELLGVNLKNLPETEFSGIKKNANAIAKYTAIEIGINGYFFSVPVLFSDSISASGYGIVGQQGFFDKFKVRFDYKKGDIELKTK